MHPDFQQLMTQATRLTQAGSLQQATALIQAALSGERNATASPASSTNATPSRTAPAPAAAAPWAATSILSAARAAATDLTWRDVNWCDVTPASRDDDATTDEAADARPRADTGEIIHGRFTGAHGDARRFRLFVPSRTDGKPRPLVVMLHGCTQNPEDFARGTRMDEAARRAGFAVLYPEQCAKANPQRCWNWFKAQHQQRDQGEPALLAAMIRWVIAQHGLDAQRVFVAGLSAGGAMAAVLGQTHPDLVTAIGVHSGLAAGVANDLPSALGAMRGAPPASLPEATPVPTIVFHGDADTIVNPRNGQRVFAQATPAGSRVDKDRAAAAGATGPGSGASSRPVTRSRVSDAQGKVIAEHWLIHGAPHAWSGGSPAGSYTDPAGPDATREMVRFFLAQDPQARH